MTENAASVEIFRGHFTECLSHLIDRFNRAIPRGKHGATAAKEPMAEFCGVKESTVTRWFNSLEASPVGGEISLKLMCFLDLNGYRVIELERMPKPQRKFAELIGYSILSAQQAAELLGYSDPKGLYRVLIGENEPSEEKMEKLWQAWKQHRDELEAKKRSAPERYRFAFLNAEPKPEAEPEKSAAIVSAPRCQWQKVASSLMKTLLTLFEDGCMSNPSDEELQILQKTAGDEILQLSERLSALSSKLYRQPKGGG